ncbi:MAG: hypothetical protein Q4E02_01000 [Lagierella massiliensis]|nr:hypothetical protein [Lagierella massiliensis]
MDFIKYGLKDLIKFRKAFILFSIMTFVSLVIIVSSSSNLLYYIFLSDTKTEVNYFAVPLKTTDLETTYSDYYLKDLANVLNKGGRTSFYSEELSSKLGFYVHVFMGNYEKGSKDRYFWYVPKDSIEHINDHKIKAKSIDNDKLNSALVEEMAVFDEGYQIVKVIDPKYKDLMSYGLNNSEIISLIAELSFSEEDKLLSLDKDFEEIFKNQESQHEFLQVGNSRSFDNSEDFLLKYMVLMYVLILIFMTMAYLVFLKFFTGKMLKEFRIHIIFGARIKDIFKRCSIFVLMPMVLNFIAIYVLNGFNFDTVLLIAIITLMAFFILGELAIYLNLSKLDFSSRVTRC